MSFTNYLAAEILDHLFTDGAYAPPATLYLGLSTTTPTEGGGNFTEPTDGYSRVATTAADWAAATVANPAVKTTVAEKSFPTAAGSWGEITHCGLWYASTGGNLLSAAQLETPRTVGAGDILRFGVGGISLTLT